MLMNVGLARDNLLCSYFFKGKSHNEHGVLYIRSDKVGRVIKKGSDQFKCFRPLIILIYQHKHIVQWC